MIEAPSTPTVVLHEHPATPAGAAFLLDVHVQAAGGEWVLQYHLRGPMAQLRIPPAAAAGPADGLWQHTCFEAFVAAEDEPGYREFNFSPSGQWAAYRFAAERVRDTEAETTQPVAAPRLHTVATPHSLQLTARLTLPALPAGATRTIGLAAVIEEADGRLSYWALNHPGHRPDFHHRDGRTLRLAAL